MRLIDADAMLTRNKDSIYDTADLEEMLSYESTAFDVEKVIELINASGRKMSESKMPHNYYKAISVKRAVEIIRRCITDESRHLPDR